MTNLSVLHRYGEELEKALELRTFPLAVKLLEREGDIPEGATRPKRDLGYHLSLCQAFSLSRMKGMSIAELKEDMWCHEPVIGLGMAEPPQYYLEGNTRLQYFKTPEEAVNSVRQSPRLPVGKYVGIVSAPLKTANFEPDLVIIYCNPAQLSQLILARRFVSGGKMESFASALTSGAACVFATVPVIQSRQCQLTLPCSGDRRNALAQDDEVVFTIPGEKLDAIAERITQIDFKLRFATPFDAMPEYTLFESYAKVSRLLGMETSKDVIPGM